MHGNVDYDSDHIYPIEVEVKAADGKKLILDCEVNAAHDNKRSQHKKKIGNQVVKAHQKTGVVIHVIAQAANSLAGGGGKGTSTGQL